MVEFEAVIRKEVDENYAVFAENVETYLILHKDSYALMRHGEVLDFFQTWLDAHRAGNLLFRDSIFSVQKVTKDPVDLGYFSRV